MECLTIALAVKHLTVAQARDTHQYQSGVIEAGTTHGACALTAGPKLDQSQPIAARSSVLAASTIRRVARALIAISRGEATAGRAVPVHVGLAAGGEGRCSADAVPPVRAHHAQQGAPM